MERLARDSVELAALAEPDPDGGAAGAPRRWRATSPSWICGTTRVLSLDVARRRSGARARARRRRWSSTSASPTPTARCSGGPWARRRSRRRRGFRDRCAARTCRSRSSRSATTPTARSATVVLDRVAVRGRARGRRRRRARGGAAHGRQAGRAQDPDRRGARDLLARRGARAARPVRRRDVGRRDLAAFSSYLAGREGTAVASPLVEIVDDPLLRRGPGLAARSTARGSPAGPTCWCPAGCCGPSCATCTRRASWGAARPARRRAGSAAARTSASPT